MEKWNRKKSLKGILKENFPEVKTNLLMEKIHRSHRKILYNNSNMKLHSSQDFGFEKRRNE